MNSGFKRGPKKIEISSSSLVALKAELQSKKAQVQSVRYDGTTTIRRQPTKKKAVIKNVGVEARAKLDEEQRKEDEPSLEKSRLILEEKAKLYERLSKDRKLLDEDTISEDQSLFLVDFQQKVVENVITQRRSASKNQSKVGQHSSSDEEIGREDAYPAANPEEEWVDFVDSFGRTRRCLKKDLPVYQKQDVELNKAQISTPAPTSYGNFVAAGEDIVQSGEPQSIRSVDEEARRLQRQLWEEEEEKNRQKPKVHYQDILYQEARQHGVGFYSFSKDEEERAKQMEELENIRRQTEAARTLTAQVVNDKQAALEARLKKVRDRKRQKLGLPPLKEEPKPQPTPEVVAEDVPETTPATDAVKEAEDNLRKTVARSLPQSVKVRPWDLGKEGVPKKPVMTQSTWVEGKREERRPEFAPPAAYNEDNSSTRPRKQAKHHQEPKIVEPEPVLTEDSIISGLAFLKQMQYPSTGVPPAARASETLQKYEEEIEENDDGLRPPGETDMSQPPDTGTSRWRSVPTRGAEIAPPSCMEYYNNSSSKTHQRSGSNQRTDMSQSFSVGINQRKNAVNDNPSTSTKEESIRCKWNFS